MIPKGKLLTEHGHVPHNGSVNVELTVVPEDCSAAKDFLLPGDTVTVTKSQCVHEPSVYSGAAINKPAASLVV